MKNAGAFAPALFLLSVVAVAAAAVVSVLKALVLSFSTLCKSVKVKGKSQYKVYEKAKQILYIVFFFLCKTVKVV